MKRKTADGGAFGPEGGFPKRPNPGPPHHHAPIQGPRPLLA